VDKKARAWARRNSPHVGPIRRGAGPRPPRRSTVAIVVAEILIPKLEELALDPQVAPPGVLPSQAKDQLAQFGIDRRASRPAARPRVHSALELAAPALERLGHDSEGRPPLPGEEPARRGEEDPVGGAVAGPLPSPGEHPQLMAEHGDLKLPVIQARPNEQADQAA